MFQSLQVDRLRYLGLSRQEAIRNDKELNKSPIIYCLKWPEVGESGTTCRCSWQSVAQKRN